MVELEKVWVGVWGAGRVRYQPAFTALLLLLSDLQPLPQQETLAPRRGTGRGASRPGGGGVFVAGWRDLDGGQLEVFFGGGARSAGKVTYI